MADSTTFKSQYTDRQWEFVYELWCIGYPLRDLASWLSIHLNTIKYHFRRLGFTPEERIPLSEYNEQFERLGDSDV